MSLLKKIGFYLIGLSLGMIILTFILKGKNTEICYFPNCRVLKDIRSKELRHSESILKLMEQETLKPEDIREFLSEGNINFRKSETETSPCKTYYIEGELNEKATALIVKNCDGYAEVVSLTEISD